MSQNQTTLDKKMLLRRVAGDRELLMELVTEFKASYPILVNKIKQVCEDPINPIEVERLAHNLKNSLQVFFKGEVINKIYLLEVAGRNKDTADITLRYQEFAQSIISAESTFMELYDFGMLTLVLRADGERSK